MGLFYYHTVETVEKVLQNGTIRSRSYRYLNDKKEVESGLDLVKAYFEAQSKDQNWGTSVFGTDDEQESWKNLLEKTQLRLASPWPPVMYPLCFTSRPPMELTSLQHWLLYAHEGGVAIEVDFGRLTESMTYGHVVGEEVKGSLAYRHPGSATPNHRPGKVEYVKGDPGDGHGVYPFHPKPADPVFYAAFIKNQSFKSEQEYRLAFVPGSGSDGLHFPCQFWLREGLFNSFIDVTVARELQRRGKTHWKRLGWPIVSLTVGPSPHQERQYFSLIDFLSGSSGDLKVMYPTAGRYLKNVESCFARWKSTHFSVLTGGKPARLMDQCLDDLKLWGSRSGSRSDKRYDELWSRTNPLLTCYQSLDRLIPKVFRKAALDCYVIPENGLLVQRAQHPFRFGPEL